MSTLLITGAGKLVFDEVMALGNMPVVPDNSGEPPGWGAVVMLPGRKILRRVPTRD